MLHRQQEVASIFWWPVGHFGVGCAVALAMLIPTLSRACLRQGLLDVRASLLASSCNLHGIPVISEVIWN